MAFIDGYVRGKPARIADNLVCLFPDVYSADPPAGEAPATDDPPKPGAPTKTDDPPKPGEPTKTAAARRESRKEKH